MTNKNQTNLKDIFLTKHLKVFKLSMALTSLSKEFHKETALNVNDLRQFLEDHPTRCMSNCSSTLEQQNCNTIQPALDI